MKSLLSKIKKSDVITEPFPHILVKDALEDDLYLKLFSELPSINVVSKGAGFSSNRRFDYWAKDVFGDEKISPVWKEFMTVHTSSIFLNELITILKDFIFFMHPSFTKDYGFIETFRPGIRGIDTFETVDILLDALISVNTPVIDKPASIRRAHVDLPDKLFAGLFYMRDPQDTSTGGDLELYKFKKGKPYGFKQCEIPDEYVNCVKTIKYERNVFILFVNSIHSLHGVTVRSLTDFPRYFINVLGEVKKPLFDPFEYQEPLHLKLLRRAKQKVNV
jgi:hypothetical protein